MEGIRLNKYISASGYCSRREADRYIEEERVVVNGKVCSDLTTLVSSEDRITVDGESIKSKRKPVYIALNKPKGITCTTDPKDMTNIADYMNYKERIFPIGRLDKPSQGLILLTNNGDIVNKILRAGNNHEKEYIVVVDKPITASFVTKMSEGMRLDRGETALPCKVKREGENRFRIILTQGLNRQIRRMCMMLDYKVTALQRVRVMNVTLDGIPEGKWRYLSPMEIDDIMELIKDSSNTHSPIQNPAPKKFVAKGGAYKDYKKNKTNKEDEKPAKKQRPKYKPKSNNVKGFVSKKQINAKISQATNKQKPKSKSK